MSCPPACKGDPKQLDDIIAAIMDSYTTHAYLTNHQQFSLPSREAVSHIVKNLELIVFPGLVENSPHDLAVTQYHAGSLIISTHRLLSKAICEALKYAHSSKTNRYRPTDSELPNHNSATQLSLRLLESIPDIREMLHSDMRAAYKGDPAAKSYAEIILSYPGFRALTIHRLAHRLYQLGIPMLPRMMSELIHRKTGIDIHPGAKIGRAFFIDHGTGVVIGETTVIGNHVKIYQGVTLGALSIPDPDSANLKQRHPTLEDNVTIYAGATILGGKTVVGARSVIGSNVWLTHSVDPDSKVIFVPPEIRIKSANNLAASERAQLAQREEASLVKLYFGDYCI